jgi:hypothetical protein
MLRELTMKLDALIQDRETLAMMIISERALKDFLSSEPDLYSPRDRADVGGILEKPEPHRFITS